MTKYKKFWGIFFSILFLWLALRKIDFYAIPQHLEKVNPLFLGLMLISYTLEHVTRTLRWQYLLPDKKFRFKDSYCGIVLGFFFNNILPARAGEFYRAYYLSKKNIANSGEAFGSIVIERFLDGIMLITLIFISLNRFSSHELLRKAQTACTSFYSLVLIALLFLIFKRNWFVKAAQWCFSFLPAKISSFLDNMLNKFIDGISTIKKPVTFFKVLIISIIAWITSILTLWLCLKAFGFEENVITASFMLTVLTISSMVPASPGQIGVYEFFAIFLMKDVLGYSGEQGAAFAFVIHGFQYIYVLIAGAVILFAFNDTPKLENSTDQT